MRALAFLSVFCTAAAAACGLSSPFHNCTLGSIADCAPTTSIFQIQAQGFGPDPPVVNENVTLWIQYIVPSSVNVASGTSVDSVSLNGLPVSSETSDLCKSIPCPQTAGVHNASNSFPWPSGIASGSRIVYTSKWYDPSQTLLLCSKLTLVA
jgi:hypothetical protein